MCMTVGENWFPPPAVWQRQSGFRIRSATMGITMMLKRVSTIYKADTMIL